MRKEAQRALVICSTLIGVLLIGAILMTPRKTSTLPKVTFPVRQSTDIKAGDWVTIHDGFWDDCVGRVMDKKAFDKGTGKPSTLQIKIWCDYDKDGNWGYKTNEDISIKNLKLSKDNWTASKGELDE